MTRYPLVRMCLDADKTVVLSFLDSMVLTYFFVRHKPFRLSVVPEI